MHARSLLSLTPLGIAELAKHEGMLPEELIRHSGYTPERIERIVAMMERAFQVRTFLLWLQRQAPGWEWSTLQWDVEIAKLFNVGDRGLVVPFHGGAVLTLPPDQDTPRGFERSLSGVDQDNRGTTGERWVTIAVEWDLRRVPVEKDRARARQVCEAAQNDPRFCGWTTKRHFLSGSSSRKTNFVSRTITP